MPRHQSGPKGFRRLQLRSSEDAFALADLIDRELAKLTPSQDDLESSNQVNGDEGQQNQKPPEGTGGGPERA